MTTSSAGDFAWLVPRNNVAQLLFSRTYAYVEKNDELHLRFMNSTGGEPLPASEDPVESSTEYDTHLDSDTNSSSAKALQHLGYFVLSFDAKRRPDMPGLGWRVGRGTSKALASRNVDLLLAKPGDNMAKSLASVHMIFQFNPRSGFLMLRGGSPKVPVEYNISGKWDKLYLEERQLIYQTSTALRAGACEYELQYFVEEEHKEAYFCQRDIFLESMSSKEASFQPPFRKIPGESTVLRGKYLEFDTQGFGAFGWISQGVDTKTGELVAIKELRINNHSSRCEAMAEVEMGSRFLHKRGLLPILDASCEHGHTKVCCDMEKFYIFLPYALSDLSFEFWTSSQLSRCSKLRWLREPLEGLQTLHAMGIMHRDIRLRNMLRLSNNPARASICDYGKAIKAENSMITTIGPICTLAPEVWTVTRDGPYTNKIDMWAYGYAIAEVLGYSIPKYPGADGFHGHNPAITHRRHAAILDMLRAHCEKAVEDRPLADLASKLLAWKPAQRPSAVEALQHECWSSIMQEGEEGGEGGEGDTYEEQHALQAEFSQVKRTKTEHPKADPGGHRALLREATNTVTDVYRATDFNSAAGDTQPHSEETLNYLRRRYGG